MPTLANNLSCTGCAACMNSCAKKAISMEPQGVLGHLYPKINTDRCVECGLCEKNCPVFKDVQLQESPFVYAGWAKDANENKKSSSGGVASILSKVILENGGVVYGCANIGMDVKHVRIDNVEDIDLLRGSKYVQSTINYILQDVRKDLLVGKQVLFVGTPCQCAGLKTFLHKDYDNLLLVDLICHGTPSLKLLQDHVSTIVSPDQIVKHIYFRDGSNFAMVIKNADEKEIYQSNLWKNRYHDAYYNTFILGYTYRPSCNSCRYAQSKRCSDITIGDFWGLGDKTPFEPIAPAFGYSAILPNTKKGLDALKLIENRFYLQQRELKEAVEGNPQLHEPKKLSFSARVFQWCFSHGISLKKSLYIADWYKIPVYKIVNKLRNR